MRLNQYTRLIIFLSAFLLAASPSFSLAPDLILSMNGQDVTGKTVTIEGKNNDELIKASFVLSNTSGKAIQVKVRKTAIKTIPGSQNAVCLGECFPPALLESPNPFQLAANASTPAGIFYAEYYPNGQAGTSEIRYEVFDIANIANTVSVVIRFDARDITNSLLSPEKRTEFHVSPNPALNGLCTITFPPLPSPWVPDRLVITDQAGRRESVIISTDQRNQCILSLEGKANGMYFLSVFSGNRQLFTEKLIVAGKR